MIVTIMTNAFLKSFIDNFLFDRFVFDKYCSRKKGLQKAEACIAAKSDTTGGDSSNASQAISLQKFSLANQIIYWEFAAARYKNYRAQNQV